MKNLLRLLLAAVILLWQATAYARPRSTVEMMEELNSISLLKPFYQIRIFVNEDPSGPEELIIEQFGDISSKYAGRLEAAGRSSKQLAYEIRRIIQKQEQPSALRIPESARQDPLVRISVTGVLESSNISVSTRHLKENETIEPRDIIRIWEEGQPRKMSSQRVAITGEILAFGKLVRVDGLNVHQVHDMLRQQIDHPIIVGVLRNKALPPQRYSPIATPYPWPCPTVTIFGKVPFQGEYALNPGHDNRVSEFVRYAGGFAKKTLPLVQISRQTPHGSKLILLNAKAIWRDNNPDYDLFVRPNDVIIVK